MAKVIDPNSPLSVATVYRRLCLPATPLTGVNQQVYWVVPSHPQTGLRIDLISFVDGGISGYTANDWFAMRCILGTSPATLFSLGNVQVMFAQSWQLTAAAAGGDPTQELNPINSPGVIPPNGLRLAATDDPCWITFRDATSSADLRKVTLSLHGWEIPNPETATFPQAQPYTSIL